MGNPTVEIILVQSDIRAIKRCARGRNGAGTRPDGTRPSLKLDFNAAAAELCVARWLGVEWSESVNAMYDLDVDPYEVKYTDNPKYGLLVKNIQIKIHGPDTPAILVQGIWPAYILVGWQTLGKVKELGDQFTRPDRKYWVIPPNELRPMRTAPVQPR